WSPARARIPAASRAAPAVIASSTSRRPPPRLASVAWSTFGSTEPTPTVSPEASPSPAEPPHVALPRDHVVLGGLLGRQQAAVAVSAARAAGAHRPAARTGTLAALADGVARARRDFLRRRSSDAARPGQHQRHLRER